MTNEQALKILEDATAMLQLNRNDHQVIAKALMTLRVSLTPKAEEKPKEEKKDSTPAPVSQ